jgi:tRNA-splicing ligase RtcB
MPTDSRLERLDANRLRVINAQRVEATLFANEDVPVEKVAVAELLTMLQLRETVERMAETAPESFDTSPSIDRVAVTPDFHKAAGIPVGTVLATRGFVVPQAIGNDINCGMRLHITDLTADRVSAKLDELETTSRRMYFEAGRNIPMTRVQREAMLRNGLMGLLDAVPKDQAEGLWPLFHEADLERELTRVEQCGSLPAKRVFGLSDFMGPADRASRDSQIGSIGGGNHFVEIQRVDRILDSSTAHAWGLKVGMVTIMVHTGSLMVGHLCGGYYRDVVRRLYPASLKHPFNGVFILPLGERHREEADRFWDALHNAANFAFANRLFLSLMASRPSARSTAGSRRRCCTTRRTTCSGEKGRGATPCICTARARAPPATPSRWPTRRSATPASRCWCPARWGRAASSWWGKGTRNRCGAPATGQGGLCHAATRGRGTTRSSRRSWSASAS